MSRTAASLALLAALAALACPATASASAAEAGTHGVLLGVGYGLHRSFNGALAAQDFDQSRAFDGFSLQAHAGYQAGWGGLIALDFAFSAGSNVVSTQTSQLRLDLKTETLSVLVGGEWGPGRWVRFHVGALAGVAVGQFERTFETSGATDSLGTTAVRPALGLQAGIDVLPLRWLSLGLRGRIDASFDPTSGGDGAGLGGAFVGLAAGVVL